MNSVSSVEEIALLAAMARWNESRTFPGKRRDTKKKLNRGIRKNRMIMTRNSRRNNGIYNRNRAIIWNTTVV